MRKVCLAIGVTRAEGLAPLRAAATAAEDIGQWAVQSGFSKVDDVRVLTDRTSPVTVELIAKTIRELLPIGVETNAFLLHFAGHGMREDNTRTLWLPTNWRTELRAIAVERLKNRLSDFGIANLTIISDACKAFGAERDTSDLTPDGVVGSGTSAGSRPILDRYDAVHDMESAFMIPGPTPTESRCLFSGALIEALWGDRRAIDPHYPGMVTPGSLADYLSIRVDELCDLYKLSSKPFSMPGRPADHLIYYDKREVANSPPVLPSWPAPFERFISKSASTPPPSQRRWLKQKELARIEREEAGRQKAEWRETTVAALSTGAVPEPQDVNLVLRRGTVAAIWSADHVENKGGGGWKANIASHYSGQQLVVEYTDGIFAPLMAYPALVTIGARDTRGTNGWFFRSPYDNPGRAREAAQILVRMQSGELPASEVDRVAARLRFSKHCNPMQGAICSYLYDYAGDLSSIRRMAYFYVVHEQPIPYDIALMGELLLSDFDRPVTVPAVSKREKVDRTKVPSFVSEATPETNGFVGGLCPWLRQGWDFVQSPTDREASLVTSLPNVHAYLRPETFTAFDRTGGELLVNHWGMIRWQ